jgi:N-acetylneuraminate synthase/N,N'-diacetyllegionaminate synthase
MASVFDHERFLWLEEFGVKRHKIASRTSKLMRDLAQEIVDTGKPCYMSLGFSSKPFEKHYSNLHYLSCISEYPTELEKINIPERFKNYNPEIDAEMEYEGFSDHSLGIGASLIAVGRGATIVEKHFTYDKSAVGVDHMCSITPDELRDLAKYAHHMGKIIKSMK